MPERYFDGDQPLDFDDYANQLLEQGLQTSPAALHGGVCGVLVGCQEREPDYCLALISQALEVEIHGELAGSSLQLIVTSMAALADEEFDFQLFLPDEDTDIESRVVALADWCRGFLAVYALVIADPDASTLGAEVAEILKDISSIAEVGFDEEGEAEEAEDSFFELTEYLRFAILNMYLDMASKLDSDNG